MTRQFATPVLLQADPTDPLGAVTKQYADNADVPAGVTAANILNIGPQLGQNHFALQSARLGDPAYFTKTQAELAKGYTEAAVWAPNASLTAANIRVQVGAPPIVVSGYARTELRELDETGANMAFDPTVTGTHRLHGRTKITNLPTTTPEIVICQLHNGTTDRVVIRTQLVSGTIRLRIRVNGTSVTPELASPYVVGTEFEWMIETVNGALNVYYNNLTTPIYTAVVGTLVSTGGATWYFKAGCYLQENTSTDTSTDYGQVELRDLYTFHTGATPSAKFYGVPQHAASHATGGQDAITPASIGAALGYDLLSQSAFELTEHFLAAAAAQWNVEASVSGTGALTTPQNFGAAAGFPGIVQLQTGSTATGASGVGLFSPSAMATGLAAATMFEAKTRLFVPTLNTSLQAMNVEFGLSNCGSAAGTMSAGAIMYVSGTTGTWQIKNGAGTAGTIANSITLSANTTVSLVMQVPAGSNTAYFYVNGVLLGSVAVTVGSGGGCIVRAVKTVGTTNLTCSIDYFGIRCR